MSIGASLFAINFNIDFRKNYIYNSNFRTLTLSDVFLFIGTNPIIEYPILNMQFRKMQLYENIRFFYIGNTLSFNYNICNIGIKNEQLLRLLLGKIFYSSIIFHVNDVMCIFGTIVSKLNNTFYPMLLELACTTHLNFPYNTSMLFSGDISIGELGMLSKYRIRSLYTKSRIIKMCYFICINYEFSDETNLAISENIYQGYSGSMELDKYNVILPNNVHIENSRHFFNCEGRFFISNMVIHKKNKVINNETIIYNILNLMGIGCFAIYLFVLIYHKLLKLMSKYTVDVKVYILFIIKIVNRYFINIITTLKENYKIDFISRVSYNLSVLLHRSTNFV